MQNTEPVHGRMTPAGYRLTLTNCRVPCRRNLLGLGGASRASPADRHPTDDPALALHPEPLAGLAAGGGVVVIGRCHRLGRGRIRHSRRSAVRLRWSGGRCRRRKNGEKRARSDGGNAICDGHCTLPAYAPRPRAVIDGKFAGNARQHLSDTSPSPAVRLQILDAFAARNPGIRLRRPRSMRTPASATLRPPSP